MVLKIGTLADGSVMEIEREIMVFPYAANSVQREIIRLQPNMLNHILLHVVINFTSPGVKNIDPSMPWRLIRRISVTTPRGEILKDVSGLQLHLLNMMERGTNELSTFPTNIVGTTYQKEFDLCIPFYNYTGIESTLTNRSTALNTNEFTELFLRIEWLDAAADIYGVPDLTINSVECHVNILEREPVNTSDRVEPRKKLIDFDDWYTQINVTTREILIPQNTLIKTIMLTCFKSDWTPFAANADVITRVAIEDDGHAHSLRELTGPEIKSQNQAYYHMEPGQAGGIYIIEFDQMRDLTSLYKTIGVSYPKLIVEFDETAVETLQHFGVFFRQIASTPALTTLRK